MFVWVAVLVPLIAVLFSVRQPATYMASAQVLLNRQDLADKVTTKVQDPYVDPAREAQTEAQLARVSEVASRAVAAVPGHQLTPRTLLKSSKVTANYGSDLLTFVVTYTDPELAKRFATAYAVAFAGYRRDLDSNALAHAQETIDQRLQEAEAAGLKKSALYRSLIENKRDVTGLQALHTPRALVVHRADRATKVGPMTIRNALLGLTLGIVLAAGIVFLVEALDSRVRSPERIRDDLGLRLLGRLSAPPRELQENQRLVMVESPLSREAEAFRVLRAGLDFANAELGAQTVLVTSALPGEGKSTTVANLAVALARAGRHVVLADFDLRNPSVHRFFDLRKRPGLVDIALGDVSLENAIQTVPVTEDDLATYNGRRSGRSKGRLEVLPVGHTLQDPDEVGATLGLGAIVQDLRKRADVVLIDSAPLLPIGDTISLSAHVDALVLVVLLDSTPASTLRDVREVLTSAPVAKLGLIITGADLGDSYSQYRYPVPQPTRGLYGSAPPARTDAGEASATVEDTPAYSYTKEVGLEE